MKERIINYFKSEGKRQERREKKTRKDNGVRSER